jgi:NhaP-type Na+/H+ or K+/H+ antiporter
MMIDPAYFLPDFFMIHTASSRYSLAALALYAKNYALIGLLLALGWLVPHLTAGLLSEFAHDSTGTLLVFFEALVILIFGFLANELARPTVIPSFVLAVFIGMLERHSLAPLTTNPATLGILTTLGAALILFGGGLDTPFRRFRALIGPILSVAFFGTVITALLLSLLFLRSASASGITVSVGAIVLLGAALASTDPAAIIPSLKSLIFKTPRIKDIAVSESAINDVVGAVLTGVFLTVVTAEGDLPPTILGIYSKLLTPETGFEVLWELLVGCAVGFGGFLILRAWSNRKARLGEGGEADAALFLAVPLLCYLIAVYLHGSGFLAVFIAGLLFQLEDHVSHVEHYFVHTIEGFMKPLIFMLLGASVDIAQLLNVTTIGIVTGLLFMFVIRPVAVFVTLSPFMLGRHKMNICELLFLSFVRETGVIPAVLLMGLAVSGIPGTEIVVPVGLWVILLTLIVQPPLTPLIARLLGVAENAPAFPQRISKGSIAVLCSRGHSFVKRLEDVIDWADRHGVKNVTLLHCPEDKYSESYIDGIKKEAEQLFAKIHANRSAENKSKITFEFLGRPGMLQENIEELVENDDVAVLFVGSKMLDYRMQDVKSLRVPFVFLP